MIRTEIHPELGWLFLGLTNTPENTTILNYLLSIAKPLSETYTNYWVMDKGYREPRKYCLEYSFNFKAGKTMLAKLKKRYKTLVFEPL